MTSNSNDPQTPVFLEKTAKKIPATRNPILNRAEHSPYPVHNQGANFLPAGLSAGNHTEPNPLQKRMNSPSCHPVKSPMHALSCFLGATLVAAGMAIAAEPSRELDETLAARLINLQSDNRTPHIKVALILEGTTRNDCFETKHVRRVVALHPVNESGRQVRRMNVYDFQWNETLGWFTWEQREERGGDAVWIWSELQGQTVTR